MSLLHTDVQSVATPISVPVCIPRTLEENSGLNEDYIRPLVRDLHRVEPRIYWTDFLLSCAIGWAAFVAAVVRSQSLLLTGALALLAFTCLYRGLCFVHEISHQTHKSLAGFETAYNWLIGFPLLMPSFVYVGMHQSHHRVDLYGTEADPEYLPFSQSWLMTTVFALEGFLIPIALLIRFLLVSPLGFLSKRVQVWLATHLSSLTMNPKYRRQGTPAFVAKVWRDSLLVWVLWMAMFAFSASGIIGWRWFGVWLFVLTLTSFVNTLRTLGAHAYEGDGEVMSREAQLRDSIDTPGAIWTEVWAPVGLRYHALHHYFPGIPYHNLPEAYRRIVHCLPVAESYREMSSPSLGSSLSSLLYRGWRRVRG